MQKYADPLGIERIVNEQQSLLDANVPTQEQFDTWNQHPITIRMKKAIALDLYRRNQEMGIAPNQEFTTYLQGLINYGVAEGEDD